MSLAVDFAIAVVSFAGGALIMQAYARQARRRLVAQIMARLEPAILISASTAKAEVLEQFAQLLKDHLGLKSVAIVAETIAQRHRSHAAKTQEKFDGS